MARAFDDAATQDIEIASAILTAVPISMSAWFNSDDIGAHQVLIGLTDFSVVTQYILLIAAGLTGGDPVQAIKEGAGSVTASTSTGFSANTWHHAAGVFAAVADTRVYIDGGSKGTSAVASTPSGLDTTTLGSLRRSAGSLWHMSGRIAEAAIWNIALSDAEVAVLAEGYSPLLVHPQNLVFYAPLVRELVEPIGGVTLTNAGSTVGDHCRVLYPPPPSLIATPAVAVAAIASQRLKIGHGR